MAGFVFEKIDFEVSVQYSLRLLGLGLVNNVGGGVLSVLYFFSILLSFNQLEPVKMDNTVSLMFTNTNTSRNHE